MSIYLCSSCDEYKDADIHECHADPRNEWDCICLNCLVENFPECE